jgi:hypothetical protein
MADMLSGPKDIGESTRKPVEEKLVIMKGKVIANVLNIRAQPSKGADVIGKLAKNNQVDILGLNDGWYEIKFKDSNAFVVAEFVEELMKTGVVNSNLLNIRNLPNKDAEKIDQISKGKEVTIVDEIDGWFKIKYKAGFGYVFGEFIDIKGAPVEKAFLFTDPELFRTSLEPAKKLEETGSHAQIVVKSTYNKYGNLLSVLCKKLGIDLAAALAVFSVESGGVALNKGRIVIRFENHIFYNYWGKFNQEEFQKHFRFTASIKGHQFRRDSTSEWIDFHGNQDREYEVLNFARTLDNEKALYSISMGLPQMMGFNAKIVGYNTAQEMFDKFTQDIRYQVFAFFDFLSPQMISYFRAKEFVRIAEYYNGMGQAQMYGKIIHDYCQAFPSNMV